MKREKAIEVARAFLHRNVGNLWKYGVVFYSIHESKPSLIAFFGNKREAQKNAWDTQCSQLEKGNYYYYAIFYKNPNEFPDK